MANRAGNLFTDRRSERAHLGTCKQASSEIATLTSRIHSSTLTCCLIHQIKTADKLQRGDHEVRCVVVVEFHIVVIIFQSVLIVSPPGEKQLVGARC